ncbi:hypothetical protein STENM327S_06176 [Streptomyces tendae]
MPNMTRSVPPGMPGPRPRGAFVHPGNRPPPHGTHGPRPRTGFGPAPTRSRPPAPTPVPATGSVPGPATGSASDTDLGWALDPDSGLRTLTRDSGHAPGFRLRPAPGSGHGRVRVRSSARAAARCRARSPTRVQRPSPGGCGPPARLTAWARLRHVVLGGTARTRPGSGSRPGPPLGPWRAPVGLSIRTPGSDRCPGARPGSPPPLGAGLGPPWPDRSAPGPGRGLNSESARSGPGSVGGGFRGCPSMSGRAGRCP